jgi:hypothetical protein
MAVNSQNSARSSAGLLYSRHKKTNSLHTQNEYMMAALSTIENEMYRVQQKVKECMEM